jgi:hypothetical protein
LHSLFGNRADEREVRVGIGVRVHHRDNDGRQPFAALDMGADRGAAGTELGAVSSMLERILVAARRARLRLAASAFALRASADKSARQARAGRVFSAVGILLGRSAGCAAFGKIIVPCARQTPPPSRGLLT